MGPPPADLWERRLRRIDVLSPLHPEAADLLRFFRVLTEFQRGLACRREEHTAPLPGDLDLLLALVEREGPPGLAARVPEIRGMSMSDKAALLGGAGSGTDAVGAFFARSVAAPFAAIRTAGPPRPGRCPCCGEAPAVAVLRDDREAEAIRRSLVCSLCATEWEHLRVSCPACGEEDPAKLPRFTATALPWIRVDACDTCGAYLKAVDLSKEPEADPIVDELAAAALDVVARERGYVKIAPNAAGL